MAGTFWETMGEFEAEAVTLHNLHVTSHADMFDIRTRTVETIAASRELMWKVDLLLENDPWCTVGLRTLER